MKLGIAGLTLLALVACTPANVPPSPDASDASLPSSDAARLGDALPSLDASGAVLAACASLRLIACREGAIGVCETTLAKVEADRLTDLNLPCVVAATSGAAVRQCAATWANACR